MSTDQKRILSFWLSIIIGYIVPILIISFKYDLFKTYVSVGTKISTWLIIIILFLLIKLWSEFRKFIENMNESLFRESVLVILEIGPYILLLMAAFLVDYFAQDFVFVTKVIAICFLASTPFLIYHRYYNRKRKIARGDVRVLR